MTPRQFFASIRRMFALDANKVSTGAAVVDHIENEYIPALEKLIREGFFR